MCNHCIVPCELFLHFILYGQHCAALKDLSCDLEVLMDMLTLKVLVTTIDELGQQDNYSTVGGDGGCRVDTTSPMPDHNGFKLQ